MQRLPFTSGNALQLLGPHGYLNSLRLGQQKAVSNDGAEAKCRGDELQLGYSKALVGADDDLKKRPRDLAESDSLDEHVAFAFVVYLGSRNIREPFDDSVRS